MPDSQKIRFPCPKCGNSVSVAPQHAGKQGKCPGCGAVNQIPTAQAASLALARKAKVDHFLARLNAIYRDAMLELFREARSATGRFSADESTGGIDYVEVMPDLVSGWGLQGERLLTAAQQYSSLLGECLDNNASIRAFAKSYSYYRLCCDLADGRQPHIPSSVETIAEWMNLLHFLTMHYEAHRESKLHRLDKWILLRVNTLLADPTYVVDDVLGRVIANLINLKSPV